MDAAALEAGFDPTELPADRFFNWVWHLLIKDKDEQERGRLESEIYRPPRGVEVEEGPWSAAAEMDAFAEVQKSFGAK